MQLVALVEVRDLVGNARHLYLRFRTPGGGHLDLPVTVEQAGEVLGHLSRAEPPADSSPFGREVEDYPPGEVAGTAPASFLLPSDDAHLRLPAFKPLPSGEQGDDDYGGL